MVLLNQVALKLIATTCTIVTTVSDNKNFIATAISEHNCFEHGCYYDCPYMLSQSMPEVMPTTPSSQG